MYFNDKEIRAILIKKLKNQVQKPKAIIEELRVHNGNAIADVVTLHSEAHCYEIKGDNDKIDRITEQGKYYNLAFRKITLVTTEKHLQKALEITPSFWGIMIIKNENDIDGKILYYRKAQHNPDFDKSTALLTLWKDEMLSLVEENSKKYIKKSRAILAEMIAQNQQKVKLSKNITLTLLERHQTKQYTQKPYM